MKIEDIKIGGYYWHDPYDFGEIEYLDRDTVRADEIRKDCDSILFEDTVDLGRGISRKERYLIPVSELKPIPKQYRKKH